MSASSFASSFASWSTGRLLVFIWCAVFALSADVTAEDWPGWRGPRGDGTSHETQLPTKWSDSENIRWKIELPESGHASPVIVGDHLFIVGCETDKQSRVLSDYDTQTGKLRWQTVVVQSPLETKHSLNSFASSTPASDGKYVYVTFLESDNKTVVATNVSTPRDVTLGRMVVAAYDFQGEQKWIARPGEFVSVHGYCTCPVIFQDLLILNGDHDGDSYIVALNKSDGKEVWRVAREHKTRSYVTPIIRTFAGRTQMILSGSKSVTSYDPSNGKLLWYMDGPTEQFVASMVDNGRHVFLTAGFPDRHILAIDPTGSGNVTETHITWRSKRNCAYVPSPIIVGNYFLLTSDDGIASCYDATSGDRLWFSRLGSHYSTSPVTANGLVYFTADNGITKVVKPGNELEVVAENKLGDECYASPAISQGHLYFRTKKHLVSVGP